MENTYFNKGCEHYPRQEYTKAIECFQLSIAKEFNRAANAWLGQCYEYGLGTEKDLAEAKDLYQTAFPHLYGQQYRPLDNSQDNSCGGRQDNSRGGSEFTIWIEQRRFIQGLGNKLEIGGQAICNLNRNLFNEGRWRYLHL